MPPPLYLGNCNYTPIGTLGTYTLNPGPVGQEPGYFGVFYGFNVIAIGTATGTGTSSAIGMAAYDVQTIITGTGTNTVTNALANASVSAGGPVGAGPGELGVRYRGALVVVTSGTAGTANALWD